MMADDMNATFEKNAVMVPMILTVGEMILIMRNRARYSLDDLASVSGISVERLNHLEKDVYEGALLLEYVALVDSLGLSLHMRIEENELSMIEPESEKDNG